MSSSAPEPAEVKRLTAGVQKWLRDQRAQAKATLGSVPPSIEIFQMEAIMTRPGCWFGERIARQVSPYYNYSFAQQLGLRQYSVLDTVGISLAEKVSDAYSDTLQPSSLLRGQLDQFVSDTIAVENHAEPQKFASALYALAIARRHYLATLQTLDADEEDLLTATVDQLINLVEKKTTAARLFFPLQEPQLDGRPLSRGPVTIRPLTPTEAGELIFGGSIMLPGGANRQLTLSGDTQFNGATHMMEWNCVFPEGWLPGDYGLKWKQFLLAIDLLGYPLHCIGQVTATTLPEWFSLGRQSWRVDEPRIGPEDGVVLNDELLESALTLSKKLSPTIFTEPSGFNETTLRRFANAIDRINPSDGLVDFVTCLEGILLPGGGHTELSYRFRVQGAWYLAESPQLLESTFEQLKEIYEMRSRIVHRAKSFPGHSDVDAQRSIAFTLSRKGLLKALADGWPSQEDLNKLILGHPSEPA